MTERILKQGPGRVDQSGTALVLALFMITVLTVIGTMVLNTSIVEIKMANNQKISAQAFYAAEAGLERLLVMHLTDFEADSSGNAPWGNSNYAGWAETVTESVNTGTATFDPAVRSMDMYLNSNDPNLKKLTLGGGHTVDACTFDLYKYIVSSDEVYIMSRATGNGGVAAVEYRLAGEDVSPYNNAIFTDSGISGHFQGSVNVAGSIYSRGTLNVGANVHIWNNYDNNGPGGNTWTTNAIINTILNYEGDLDTKIRVKGGDLNLGAASTQIGESGTDNAIAGVYVDGSSNLESVGTHHYEEYSTEVPDVPMPTLLDGLYGEYGEAFIGGCIASEGYTGDISSVATSLYADWATGTGCFTTPSRGVVIPGDVVIDKNTASFSVLDAAGNGIIYDKPLEKLTIQGTVVILGDLDVGDPPHLDPVTYAATGADTGSGSDAAEGATLFVDGNFNLEGSFYPDQGYLKGDLYPGTNDVNSLGVVATGNISFDGHNDDAHAGFFFAEGQVNFRKQTKFAGTVISNLVNYAQVPDVYQVPNLKNYLPPAIPGGQDVMRLTRREWRRVY